MAKLSDDARKAIAEIHPALIATSSKSGKPNVSAKGSFKVLDDDTVIFADMNSPRTMANLKENPQVAVIVLNPATRKGARIWGKGEILSSGPLFDQVKAEWAAKNMKVKNVVKIAVDEAFAF